MFLKNLSIPSIGADAKRQSGSVLKTSGMLRLCEDILSDGIDLRIKVTGTSMTPFLATGSFATIARVPVSKLRIGDIIFCRCSDGSFKLHRLIQVSKDRLITKGDALVSFDEPFKKTDYKGKVVRIEHHYSGRLISRNLESQPARMKSYLIARSHQLKIYLNRIYILVKRKLVSSSVL